jgi:hypothetical protein
MSSIHGSSAPGKSQLAPAGEREILIHSLRAAVTRSRLVTNTLELVGVAVRHKQISCDQALEWLRAENLLDHIQLGRGDVATHAAYRYFEERRT